MSITKKIVNNNEFMFINSSRWNRSGFVHETELYKNDRLINTAKCQYYNRTWECYTYQSVMKSAVYGLITELYEKFTANYKAEHNIKRLTKAKREAMEHDFTENKPALYAELEKLYESL